MPPSSRPPSRPPAPAPTPAARIEQADGVVVGEHHVFDVLQHQVTWTASPQQPPSRFAVHTLRVPDWVTVVAVRPDHRVVLVRQHRFGVRAPTLETPGGIVDPGEAHEQAAARELREETGHAGGAWQSLGWVHPNPALQDNRIFFWLARDVEPSAETAFDTHEQVETVLMDRARIRRALRNGELTHALSALALERALQRL